MCQLNVISLAITLILKLEINQTFDFLAFGGFMATMLLIFCTHRSNKSSIVGTVAGKLNDDFSCKFCGWLDYRCVVTVHLLQSRFKQL